MTFKMQPDGIIVDDLGHIRLNTNKNMQRIYTAHQTLDGTAIKSPTLGGGFVVTSGTDTVTGSRTGIATGLTQVTRVVASIDNGATATNFTVTSRVTPTNSATIDLYVWQPTAAGNTTPIACTTAVVIHWWAIGSSTATQ